MADDVQVANRRLDASENEALIGTVRNVGYKFVPARHEGRRAEPRGTGPGRPGGAARAGDGAPGGAAAGGARSAGRAAHSGGGASRSASGASR